MVRFTTGDRLVIAGTLKAHGVADVFVLADAVAKALEDHARDQAEVAEGWERSDELQARAEADEPPAQWVRRW